MHDGKIKRNNKCMHASQTMNKCVSNIDTRIEKAINQSTRTVKSD